MAATCDVCGKGPGFGNSISHSHRRTKRRWNPNIQSVKVVEGSTPEADQRLHLLPEGRQSQPLSQAHLAQVVPAAEATHLGLRARSAPSPWHRGALRRRR